MTADELKQKLAITMLAETGVGLVSDKTFHEIREIVLDPESELPSIVRDHLLNIGGIRLILSPFIPDGEIWPFKQWDLRGRSHTFPKVPFPAKHDTSS